MIEASRGVKPAGLGGTHLLLVLYHASPALLSEGRSFQVGIEPTTRRAILSDPHEGIRDTKAVFRQHIPGSVAHNNAGLHPFDGSGPSCSGCSLVRFHLCPSQMSGPRDRMPSGKIRYRMSSSPCDGLPITPYKVGTIGIVSKQEKQCYKRRISR